VIPITKVPDDALFDYKLGPLRALKASQSGSIEHLSKCLKGKAKSSNELQYLGRLDESISCLKTYNGQMNQGDVCGNPDVLNLDDLFEVSRRRCADALSRIRAALLLIRERGSPLMHVHNVCWQITAQTQAWPDLSKRSILALMGPAVLASHTR